MAKKYSVHELQKRKVATLRSMATRRGIKGVSKKTKAQLIKALKPTKLSCSVAGHNMHAKTKKKRRTGARNLGKC